MNTNTQLYTGEVRASFAAKRFSITSDYITKLCRAGLVAGRRDEGIWFVDTVSLEKYISAKAAGRDAWKTRQAERRRNEQKAAGFESRAARRERILARYELPRIHVAPAELRLHAQSFIAHKRVPHLISSRVFVSVIVVVSAFLFSTTNAWRTIDTSDIHTHVASVQGNKELGKLMTQVFSKEIEFLRTGGGD